MSTDQRASERVGELIHHAFESLLQVNTDLERLQDLIGLGMDSKHILAPHSLETWKYMVPQEKRFRENWEKFISALEGADPSSGGSNLQPAAVTEAEEPIPEVEPVVQAMDAIEPTLPELPMQAPTPPPSITPTAPIKEEPEPLQHIPPTGSVDNPMEIDDTSDDDVVIQSPVTSSAKRKKKSSPSGGGSLAKRLTIFDYIKTGPPASGSKGPIPPVTPQTRKVSSRAVGSSKKLSSSTGYKWKPHKDADVEVYGNNRKPIYDRLDQLGMPFDVDRSRITHNQFVITRVDICSIYGGETFRSFPRIGSGSQVRHPYRDFLHGSFSSNPFMPPEPGWPGLFFRLDESNNHRDANGNPIVYRTFARHADKRCVYLGQYTLTKLQDISKREWRELPDKTKTIWLKYFGHKDTRLANRSLARISLRASNGGEPTEAQVLAECESLKASDVRGALADELENEIRRAFNRGEERIVVWGMKCVSYDYGFENDLATEWQRLSNASSQRESTRRRRIRRRPMSSSDDSEEDSVSVIFSSSEEDEDDLYGHTISLLPAGGDWVRATGSFQCVAK